MNADVLADVLIVGAGVGGAALGLALARAGRRVHVVERRRGPGNVNRGDSLLPSVTAQLDAWGALAAVRAAGACAVTRLEVHHARHGLLCATPLDGDAPYLVLPHPEIERVLVAAARAAGAVVTYRRHLVRLLRDGARVTGALLGDGDGGEHTVRAPLVVGADGAHSTVRAALGLTLPTRPYDHAYFIVDVDRPAAYRDALRVELHRDGGVLMVPQPHGRVGLGVLVRRADEPLFRAGALADKLAAIGRRSPILAGLRAHPGAHLYRLARGHATRYVAHGAALLGDAVHVTNPTAGQGMTLAVEDAACLARQLAPLCGGLDDLAALDHALAAYQRERRPRNAAQQRWSHALSHLYALGAPFGDPLHRGLAALAGSSLGRHVQRRVWAQLARSAA